MEYKDYYKVLGVERNAAEKEIKKAYRNLARQYHPDRNQGDKSAEERFKEINEAYEVLGDSENRTKYDQLGTNYQRWKQMGGDPSGFDYSDWINQAARAGAGSGPHYQRVNLDDLFGGASGGGGAFQGSDFSDFFSMFFGNMQRGPARSQPLHQDAEQEIEITLEEAYHGTERIMVDTEGDRFRVKIPAGADNGTKVRLRGKGVNGGDLYLVVKVLPHSRYQREGNDLRASAHVDVLTAILGGEAPVETLAGPVNLKIMPGTQGGRTVRLRKRGMPLLRDPQERGDLLVTIKLRVPTDLSAEEQALYEQLRALRE
jgi:curved DNA-binding protein